MAEAKAKISSQNAQSNLSLTFSDIVEALDILKGAVSIVYPMGLPEYDPIRMEFENREDLAGIIKIYFELIHFPLPSL